ncbi:MAG TPA: class I SAM-dependent methyltransferase [Mycobacteriales bacterium]|nr:class I SAM-dependent methyltransferase [Mycobacteriales bacterium]
MTSDRTRDTVAGDSAHRVAGDCAHRVAGDYDYEAGGSGYAQVRRTDPRIAAHVHAALGDARTVINVGAGAGSYEPEDRQVTAVEPSAAMRAQRPAHLVKAIDAVAENLPFRDNSFDAAMATITVHQWKDRIRGLREMQRVSRGPVVVLALDPDLFSRFWLVDYIPEMVAVAKSRDPTTAQLREELGGTTTASLVPIPIDCVDGFAEAFYARPEALLDPAVRQAQSAWGFIDPEVVDQSVQRLRVDIETGEWDRKYGDLRGQPGYLGSLVLVVYHPD